MQNDVKRFGSVSALALVLLSVPFYLAAQSTGTITGTVVDQAGKSVSGASVTARTEAGSGVSGTATTDAEGQFSIANLAPATYTVEATEPGFARASRLGVQVAAGA